MHQATATAPAATSSETPATRLFYTPKEVAALLCYRDTRVIIDRLKSGAIPGTKLGNGHWRVAAEYVEQIKARIASGGSSL